MTRKDTAIAIYYYLKTAGVWVLSSELSMRFYPDAKTVRAGESSVRGCVRWLRRNYYPVAAHEGEGDAKGKGYRHDPEGTDLLVTINRLEAKAASLLATAKAMRQTWTELQA